MNFVEQTQLRARGMEHLGDAIDALAAFRKVYKELYSQDLPEADREHMTRLLAWQSQLLMRVTDPSSFRAGVAAQYGDYVEEALLK